MTGEITSTSPFIVTEFGGTAVVEEAATSIVETVESEVTVPGPNSTTLVEGSTTVTTAVGQEYAATIQSKPTTAEITMMEI